MNRKLFIPLFILAMMMNLLGGACAGNNRQEAPAGGEATSTGEPVTIVVDALLERKTLDDLIAESTLIVIGEVETIHPSRWSTADGKLPEGVDPENALREEILIYTEADILVSQVLKGAIPGSMVRVRTFGGQVDGVYMTLEGDFPSFEFDRTYLLFLSPGTGLGHEHYIVVGQIQGAFIITDGKAISPADEFPLDEMLARIQEGALWTPAPTATPAPGHLVTKLRVDVGRYLRRGQIDASLERSLLDKLSAAYSSLLQGEINTAINWLEAFIQEVQAQRGKMVTEEAADDLIVKAQAIIAALSPTPTPTETPTNPPTDTPTVVPTDTPIL